MLKNFSKVSIYWWENIDKKSFDIIKVTALISTSIEIKSIHEINTDTKQTQTQRYKSKTLKDIKLHKIHWNKGTMIQVTKVQRYRNTTCRRRRHVSHNTDIIHTPHISFLYVLSDGRWSLRAKYIICVHRTFKVVNDWWRWTV